MTVPVGLYHDAFNTFQARLDDPGAPGAPHTDDSVYNNVGGLLESWADIHTDEGSRSDAIIPLMNELLAQTIEVVERPNVSSGGIIKTSCGRFSAFPAILEVKNEIGTGQSDPYHQACLAYRQYWANEKRAFISS